MNKIQSQIGQAKVLAYVTLTERHEATGNTRHHVDGQLLEGFHGLAIANIRKIPVTISSIATRTGSNERIPITILLKMLRNKLNLSSKEQFRLGTRINALQQP